MPLLAEWEGQPGNNWVRDAGYALVVSFQRAERRVKETELNTKPYLLASTVA